MSSDNDDSNAASLAATRSRRGPSRSKGKRSEALEKLKAKRNKEWNYEVEEELTDNVYEIVDEKNYAKKVQERLEEGFIVDDDGEYVEDGREIFDEEEEEDEQRGRKGEKKKKRKQDDVEEEEKKAKKRGNIKNMLLNMQGKKGKEEAKEQKLQDDQVLESLLGEIKSSSNPVLKKKKVVKDNEEAGRAPVNPFVRPKATGIKKVKEVKVKEEKVDKEDMLSMLDDHDEEIAEMEVETKVEDVTPSQNIEEVTEAELSSMMEDDFIEEEFSQKVEPEKPKNRGFQQIKDEGMKEKDLSKVKSSQMQFQSNVKTEAPVVVDVKLEQGNLPLTKNDAGEDVLRMYWLDAFEDPFKHPGTIWMFGKVWIEKANAFVSCCLTVRNIKRQIFLLKRENKFDSKLKKEVEGDEVSMEDVYKEFNGKIAERYKISEFRSKTSEKFYAFEHTDVPNQSEYLEVQYSAKYPALPSELTGETFSRVFGANQSSLENFLISRKIKGPSWLEIKTPKASSPPTSWCKVEAICENPNFMSVMTSKSMPPPPPLTIMALNLKTTVNPKTMLNEIVLVSGLVHNEFYLDKAAPKDEPFRAHFCAISKPSDEVWPFDFNKVLSQNAGKGPDIKKMDSERALLGFLLAKISNIDPDIIIGHDITGFDLDVLLHRTVFNKIPHWSRLGRLKRSQAPNFKVSDKQAMTGRLVCDLKISAKELIRCKSYELGALAERLLNKKMEDRIQIGCEEMRKAYDKSQALMNVIKIGLGEADDTLKCIYELNALPLALQITQVAGNVMSRTLLGGRAERNEYLLLHAFNERNYICPDKQYGNKKKQVHDDDAEEGQSNKTGRKKPAYTGGLVLEPKKGFYDKFILLMDFNSLYPSIIQEYNICFTTVSRKKPLNDKGLPDPDFIPEIPSSDSKPGVLPTEIQKLVESRRAVKALLKDPNLSNDQRLQYDIRQKALKLTANSMYGCLGFSHSRFFAKPLAALITSRGREILLQTKGLVEKMNLEVIYGDTDSIMINSNSIKYDEVFKLGANIKQEVNKMYKLLELDVDGVYRYMLLLKKKKYAAVTMEVRDGKEILTTELKGLDIVRRDWSEFAANAGKNILTKILSDCSADERVEFIHSKMEELSQALKDGEIPLSSLAITKQLTKNPTDYADKKALPHVQVAVRMNSKAENKKLKSGDTVEYVICEDGSNLPATQRAYHVDEVKERTDLQIDTNYYLAQQLHPVVSRLCDPLEGTDAARLAQCMGLDPEQYRRNMRGSENISPEEEGSLRDEDRFRECDKLQLTCSCGETMNLETSVRGTSKDDRILALAKCSNLKCDQKPIERLHYIQNKLTNNIRGHIKRFYSGYVICEDPACSGRTRQLPLQFRGAFPVCSTCSKAVMTKEYSDKQLYTQLLYYQQLFDVSKASIRFGKQFNHDLVTARDGQKNYALLKQMIDRVMEENKYSIIDMGKLFSGLAVMTAAGFRSSKND